MKCLRTSMWWAVAVVVAACSGNELGTTPENPVAFGQDDFVTAELDYSTRGYGYNAGAEDGAMPGASPGTKAPSGREGAVEEADIYRIDANRLFYLNTYRGFMIYDLSDPNNPQRISRLPVHGYPIEMFVTSTTVYALLRDALYVTQDTGGVRFKRHNVSQLVAIDITDLSNPRVLKTVDIVGELKEGVSRKIDDTIYVVSHLPRGYYYRGYPYSSERTEQAWVYSFNVADPQNPTLVSRLKIFEEAGQQQSSGSSWSSRWLSGVAISATANTLHVVENWYTYESVSGSDYACGSYRSMQEAVVSIVDISDPTGQIRLHSRFSTYGAITDQFKHTYVHDPATGRAYYLGIFARQEWSSTNCSGEMFVQNALEAWDVTSGANPVRVKTLAFGKPNETVRGSAFDVTRKVVYAITARQIDPLYAISFADPADLKVLSAIDGLSGDMNVFRLVGGGNFLIGIGRDNSGACTGLGDPAAGWSTNVAVSVIDVANLGAIRLVQRKCVTVNNASWVTSDLNWNLDQAHKMIGMYSDERASVISVPVSYSARVDAGDGWWYRPESAVGLMSFDLGAYDSSKDHLNQTVLKNHGTVLHPAGHVKRSIVFTHQGLTPRRMMVNLSDTHVSVVDVDDLNAPVGRSVIEVAPYHQRLFRFGAYVVDEVRQGESYYGWYGGHPGATEFRVKLAAAGLDEAQPVATFSVSRVQQAVQFKSMLVLFRQVTAPTSSEVPELEAVVYDLSAPASPVLKAAVKVPTPMPPNVWYDCGGTAWGYWPYTYANWAASDRGLGLLSFRYTQNSMEQRLVFLDLSNPSAPRVTNRVLATRTWDIFGQGLAGREYLSLVGDGQSLIANFKEQVGTFTAEDGTKFARFRYSVERYRGTDLWPEAPVSVPGRLIRSWEKDGEQHYLTTDEHFTPSELSGTRQWRPEARLHLLKRIGATAVLRDSMTVDGLQVGDMVGDADRLFLTLRNRYGYSFIAADGNSTSSEPEGDILTIIDLRQGRLDRTFSAPVGTYYSQLMGVSGHRLFVNLPGDGVLAVDVSNLSAPVGQHFRRTLGYATHIAFTGNLAFIAAGNFGIYEMDLSAPASILRL